MKKKPHTEPHTEHPSPARRHESGSRPSEKVRQAIHTATESPRFEDLIAEVGVELRKRASDP